MIQQTILQTPALTKVFNIKVVGRVKNLHDTLRKGHNIRVACQH